MCAPAVALIFSSGGEVEVFSKDKKCNQKIVDFPDFGGEGHSVDLLDEQLVLLGDNQIGGKFEYKSIHQPRKGLLGMKYSIEGSPVGNSPLWHTSHSYGNQLLAIGGHFASKARLSSSLWKELNLRRQNGSQFSSFASGACEVKMAKDTFLLIGGLEQVEDSKVELKTVLELNITSEMVKELPQIKLSRAFHACEVNGEDILISGGTQGGITVADEIYSSNTKMSTILNMTSSLKRHRHALERIEDTIFAFGGLQSDDSDTVMVQWFDWIDKTWKPHDSSLLSEQTSYLSVTPFPLAAVDCHAGCKCGVAGKLIMLLKYNIMLKLCMTACNLMMWQATLEILGLLGAVKHRCVTCFEVFYSVIA